MMYYYNERFLLEYCHDEVVHGKATILQKMNGEYEDKFPQARAMYLYMMAHPGKKLNFMGNEFGQLREWDESRHQEERCIYAIKRKGKNKNFIAIFNFSDEEQEDYELDTEEEGKLSVILDTDWDEYGGNTKKKKTLPAKAKKGTHVTLDLPPFSGILLMS